MIGFITGVNMKSGDVPGCRIIAAHHGFTVSRLVRRIAGYGLGVSGVTLGDAAESIIALYGNDLILMFLARAVAFQKRRHILL